MSVTGDSFVTLAQAQAFLGAYAGIPAGSVTLLGEGAWSRCFSFRQNNRELVIRFGRHVDDFENDRRAHAYAAPGLPVPEVLDIGTAYDGFYAVSTRVYGVPLEQLSAAAWRAAVPAVADMLEQLRLAPIPPEAGVGGWGADGRAPFARWSEFLLAVGEDGPWRRTHGWQQQLQKVGVGWDVFLNGYTKLKEVAADSFAPALVHCDLLNRNVLIDGAAVGGVFDWGCSLYGDHLMDLAWFRFWSPWHPQLDLGLLWEELTGRWREAGYQPANLQQRLTACYLWIGLDHLAYNAFIGDEAAVIATARRMVALTDNPGASEAPGLSSPRF